MVGAEVSEVANISKILNSLPSAFARPITALDSLDPAKRTLSDLIARLLKKEQRMIVSKKITWHRYNL